MSKGGARSTAHKRDLSCPRCKTDLRELVHEGTFLDHCDRCQGTFFDQGEMLAALGREADPSFWDRPETGGTTKPGGIGCPRCSAQMVLQDVKHGGEHVEIDRCGTCQGMWLDGGEGEKLKVIGTRMAGVIDSEQAAARAELDKMGDPDMRAGGIIHSFLSLFGLGKKKSTEA